VLATLTALGLGAANPAFASGGGTPDPATPVAPVAAVPETEIAVPDVTSDVGFPTSAELDLPQVETSIQTDGVNTNVDVRVLSPGSNGAVTQVNSAPGVVSSGAASDITTPSGEPAATDPSTTEAATGEIATDSTDAAGLQGANTNVSVRILSPGDNGPVTQVGTDDVEPSSSSDGITGDTSSSRTDSTQYQDANSQYQFPDDSTSEPWFWSWILTSNCADIADSISKESGDPDSLDWHWQWEWTWNCDGSADSSGAAHPNDRSSPNDPSSPTGSSGSGAVPTTDRSGAGPSTTAQPDGTWSWTWTFVLCGAETTVARTAASGTPLTWDWFWTWSSTCPRVAEQDFDIASGPADTTPRAEPRVDDALVPSNAAMTADAVEPTARATSASNDALDIRPVVQILQSAIVRSGAAAALLGWTPVTVTVDDLPSLNASAVGLVPVGGTTILVKVDLGDTSVPIAPQTAPITSQTSPAALPWPDRTEGLARRPGASAMTRSVSAEPEFKARVRAPRDTPEARPAPRLSSTSSSSHGGRDPVVPPLGPQGWLQLAGSASGAGNSSSGFVPFGFFATVTGFFVLAPPRLRRRVRPAQELGPRGRYPSPIDNPG
jgi:hypothetical protein